MGSQSFLFKNCRTMPDFNRSKRPANFGLEIFAALCLVTFIIESYLIRANNGGALILELLGVTTRAELARRPLPARMLVMQAVMALRCARQAYWSLRYATWHMEIPMAFLIQFFNLLSDSLGILGALAINDVAGRDVYTWIGFAIFLFGT